MLDDICRAHFDASATSILRAALVQFIQFEIDENPGVKGRYDAARQSRITGFAENVAPMLPRAASIRPKRGSPDD
jgi:hypothetical protein